MFRAIIKQRKALNQPQVADLPVISASITEDLTQKSSSTIVVGSVPAVSLGDLLCMYDSYGRFMYYGIIDAIEGNELKTSQFQSLYDAKHIFSVMTGTNQVNFFRNKNISEVMDFYLATRETGHYWTSSSISSSLVPTFSGFVDKDIADMYLGISHTVVDTDATYMPAPREREEKTLEDFIYEMFNTYTRVVRPSIDLATNTINLYIFYPFGTIGEWDYSYRTLFDSYGMISNLVISEADEDANTVGVYNTAGTTLRGAYTVLTDGTLQQITTNTSVPTRIGANKTAFVFNTDDRVVDLARAELPTLQYNHSIKFNMLFKGEFGFNDFNMGQPIYFYSTADNHRYDSILTGRKYEITQDSNEIVSAEFTLGKVRKTLTAKLNKR